MADPGREGVVMVVEKALCVVVVLRVFVWSGVVGRSDGRGLILKSGLAAVVVVVMVDEWVVEWCVNGV